MGDLELRKRVAVTVMGLSELAQRYGYSDPDCGYFCEMESCDERTRIHHPEENLIDGLELLESGSYHRELCYCRRRDTENDVVYESWDAVPNYESSIQAAWEVVDTMRAKGWLAAVWTAHEGGWIAGFSILDNPDIEHKSEAPTAPEAICKAALAAVQSEVK